MFLNKVFIWTIYKKTFRLESCVCFVSHDLLLSSVAMWSSMAYCSLRNEMERNETKRNETKWNEMKFAK